MVASTDTSASAFARVARDLAETHGVLPTVQGVVDQAEEIVPCDWAIVAVTSRITSIPARISASTDPALAPTIAQIAGAVGRSPGIDAFESGTTVVTNDLTSEPRYPDYALQMVRRTRVRAVLSVGLRLNDARVGVMSCYAAAAGAFDEGAVMRARVLAEHAAIAIGAARSDDRAEHLEVALQRSRTIGAAMGVLIERYRLRPDTAFAVLGRLSQAGNRKVADLAAELVETGTVEGLQAGVAQEQQDAPAGEASPVSGAGPSEAIPM